MCRLIIETKKPTYLRLGREFDVMLDAVIIGESKVIDVSYIRREGDGFRRVITIEFSDNIGIKFMDVSWDKDSNIMYLSENKIL